MRFLSIFLGFGLSLCAANVMAQAGFDAGQVTVIPVQKAASVNLRDVKDDFRPQLQNLEMPKPGANTYYNYLKNIKDQIKPTGATINKAGKATIDPQVQLRNFKGNEWAQSAPNDNDMAISNGGMVISVINSTIDIYDSTGKLLKSNSLAAFGQSLKLPHSKYDPRVLYDPLEDKFVVVFLNGFNDSTSYIIMAFSKTNDPLGDWNMYALDGEPLKDTTWSDYPIIALSKDEIFLTINSLQNGKTWQEGFRQSYIWQIDKKAAFAGTGLVTKLYSGIKFDGKPIRNICPVQGGSAPIGPEMHFVSNKNFTEESDSVFIFKVTGKASDVGTKLEMKLLKATGTYGVAPTAHQPKNHTFDTNDARILDALEENGKIHFVGNSVNKVTGLAGVFHGTILNPDNASPTVNINVIGDKDLEFGYPGIAYTGRGKNDDEVIILLNHSSDTVNPGNSVIYCKNGEYSSVQRLKSGLAFINVVAGFYERWGDYSGTQRRYNQPGTVWVGGTYGYSFKPTGELTRYIYGTWISEVQRPGVFAGIEKSSNPSPQATIYPVPAERNGQPVSVEFALENQAFLYISVYDITGRHVKTLLTEKAKAGKNIFSFDPSPFSAGQYILRISDSNGRMVSSTKFVVK